MSASPPAPPSGPRPVRIFVSSPADAQFERMRVDRVVERLNGAFADIARLESVRWEREFYKAHATFQAQIPEAADCDIVIAILRHRLGTELPADFPHMPDGQPYPSGTAYEILTAMEAAGHRGLPDIYVFRFPEPPTVKLDDAETNALITDQWNRLKTFFARWFKTPEGHFKASYHEFRSTDEFEQQVETLLRKWLEDRLLKGRAVVWPIETRGSPFRGLSAFGARHASVFFGRSRDITRSLDLLKDAAGRGAPFLLLVGASGSGKSSLVRAGLVPRLTTPGVVRGVDLWRVALFRPGEVSGDPAVALATRLFEGAESVEADDRGRPAALPELAAGDYPTPDALATLLAHGDATSTKPIIAALDKVAASEQRSAGHARVLRADLVLVVDQIDNLFTAAIAPEQRAGFAGLLASLAATGRVWIVATLRADLYERFLKEPRLFELKNAGAAYDLNPPGAAELAEIVRGPAAAAALEFDSDPSTGRTLDEVLLADADRPDMLPLLQFTLDQLFDRRETTNGRVRLTFAAYTAIGGMGGAIDRQAEFSVAALGAEEQARLPRLLRQLAEPDRGGLDGLLTIRAVPLSEAAYDEASARLVDALIEARVLLSSTEGGGTHVRLAHQRVLESWARARQIVADNASFFRVREDVEGQRRRWEAGGRQRGLLLPRGLPLVEAEAVARKFGSELPPGAIAFIAASGRRARASLRLLVAATVVFAIIAAVAVWQTFAAESRRREADAERERATRNFAAANDAVDGLTRDVVQGLRFVAGVQVGLIHDLLARVQETVDVLAATDPDNVALLRTRTVMLTELALTYQDQGDFAAAVAAAEEGIVGARRLSAAFPESLTDRRNVAVALDRLAGIRFAAGDTPGAAAPAREALDIMREVVAIAPDQRSYQADLLAALDLVGGVRTRSGEIAEGLAAFEESLAIGRQLVAAEPDSGDFRRSLSVALNKLGDAKLEAGDVAGAMALFEEGLAISRALSVEEPANTVRLEDLATQTGNVGNALLAQGDIAGAMARYREAVEINRRLGTFDRGNVDYQRAIAASLMQVGDAEVEAGTLAEALPYYDESLGIYRRLAALDSSNLERQRDYSLGLDRIGNVYYSAGDFANALLVYEEGLAIGRVLVAIDPANKTRQLDMLIGLFKVAAASGEPRRTEVIMEGTALVEQLVAAGLLTDDETQTWRKYFADAVYLPLPPDSPAAAPPQP